VSRYASFRLRKLPMVHWFSIPDQLNLSPRQQVLTRTQHGTEIATVLRVLPDDRSLEQIPEPFIQELIRPLTPEDRKAAKELADREQQAFKRTRELIVQHQLDMKLLKAEYLFDGTRLILYYKAENKVDFRDLLKSLASSFKTRIELRQIGVRDETKLLGGIGCCGKEVCCRQFLGSFHPVTTKMAKDQNLSLNPAKLSGVCQRLLCCLSYEHKYYASFHGRFPKISAEILIGTERARVMDLNFITQKVLVGFMDRRKLYVQLEHIKGRKDPQTGRNLWWVQEPGQPEPDVAILLQPIVPPAERMPRNRKDRPDKPDRPRRDDRRADGNEPRRSDEGAASPTDEEDPVSRDEPAEMTGDAPPTDELS